MTIDKEKLSLLFFMVIIVLSKAKIHHGYGLSICSMQLILTLNFNDLNGWFVFLN